MKQRIITALILAPLAIAGIFFLPLKLFMLLSAAIFLLASKEWGGFVNQGGCNFVFYSFALILGATLLFMPVPLIWVNGVINPYINYGLMAAVIWWGISLIIVSSYPRSAAIWKNSKTIKSLFGLCTLIPFFWGMVTIRSINMHHDFYFGAQLLMLVFLIVWAADTGAYFVGKKFGKHKLAPNVSPGKTREGFFGGLCSSMLVAFLASLYFAIPNDKMVIFFVAALITNIVSALGDLNESILKREAGLKDSGNLLPGHGGILDRIDSLTAAVPVFAFIYLTWLN
ncbi:phosphatidate cytidylyltransferase [Psychromonas sp. MME2]|uniref:phosphatidate cytidylyltransferase n=1 Tax=unclassified Psychromonas TaxID=2614957 RepID=UPI00339BE98D